jgi:ferric-dicitrate binding protein FerR (iron transport regulator)
MIQKTSQEAVNWLVLNESAGAEGWEISQHWEEWSTDPDNRAEYWNVMQLALALRELPPPALPSRQELLDDVAREESGSN